MLKIKHAVFAIITMFLIFNVNAQDKIILKTGSDIEAKVLEIDKNTVRYKKFNNLEGPTFVTDRNEIHMITFENGENEIFDDGSKQPDNNDPSPNNSVRTFGRNRFEASMAGVGFKSFDNNNDESFGGFVSSASYERILNDSGFLGLKIKGDLGFTEYEDIIMSFGAALNFYPLKNAKWLYLGPAFKFGSILFYDEYDGYYDYDEFTSYAGFGFVIGCQFQINRLFGIRAGMEYYMDHFDDSDIGELGEAQFQLGFNFSF